MKQSPSKFGFSEQRILVAGLARNCGKSVQNDVLRLLAALKSCRELSWLVIESDSSDNTADALGSLSAKIPGFRSISLGTLREKMPLRTQRIAHCRNAYLEELNSNPLYAEIDYVVVADLDGINRLVTPEGFASCWTRSDWDVCTANQRGPYYDIWALRHKEWCPNDCWAQRKFLSQYEKSEEKTLYSCVHSKMIILPPDSEWIEVDSAFGGLAIYRRQAIGDARYVGVNEKGEELCEHVPFHSELRRRGCRIFINPGLINAGYTEQSEQLLLKKRLERLVGLLRQKSRRVLRGMTGPGPRTGGECQ